MSGGLLRITREATNTARASEHQPIPAAASPPKEDEEDDAIIESAASKLSVSRRHTSPKEKQGGRVGPFELEPPRHTDGYALPHVVVVVVAVQQHADPPTSLGGPRRLRQSTSVNV